MVFQDPYAALNPLHTVEYALTRPVMNYTKLRGQEARARVLELLETVGSRPSSSSRRNCRISSRAGSGSAS